VLPAVAFPRRAPAGYRKIPAQDDGGRREENAPALGQLRDAQAITERLREINCTDEVHLRFYQTTTNRVNCASSARISNVTLHAIGRFPS